MLKEQLAEMLNGRQYGDEITNEEEKIAKAAGLVVVFGYSDDNAELRGAICDEIGCGDGTEFSVSRKGVVQFPDRAESEVLDRFGMLKLFLDSANAAKIKTVWGENGYSWTYDTEIPHATFEIMEDGEKFCRGIVFSIVHLPA